MLLLLGSSWYIFLTKSQENSTQVIKHGVSVESGCIILKISQRECSKRSRTEDGWYGCMPLIPAFRKERHKNLNEFEARLVYKESFRTARVVTQRNLVAWVKINIQKPRNNQQLSFIKARMSMPCI